MTDAASELILGSNAGLTNVLAGSRRANFHPIDTLLCLRNSPDLLGFSAGQPNVSTSIRPVPASLPVVVFENDPRAFAESFPIGPLPLVGSFGRELDKVAHVGISMALLALLGRLVHPAQLVFVLAAVKANTLALQIAEDVICAIVFLQILLLLPE